MNERIKALEQQALSIVLNGNDPDGDVERMYIPSEFTKKFAKLIVKECIKELEIAKKCDPYNGDLYDCDTNSSLDYVIDALKDDFGVEE